MKLPLPQKMANRFAIIHSKIIEVMMDKNLAKLGDTYVNFAFSLAESYRSGKGTNSRVPTKVLSESLKRAGLRSLLPRRTPLHEQADAVEALVIYSWLVKAMTLEECVTLLSDEGKEAVELFSGLVHEIAGRLSFVEKTS
jgi:Ribonuclease III